MEIEINTHERNTDFHSTLFVDLKIMWTVTMAELRTANLPGPTDWERKMQIFQLRLA